MAVDLSRSGGVSARSRQSRQYFCSIMWHRRSGPPRSMRRSRAGFTVAPRGCVPVAVAVGPDPRGLKAREIASTRPSGTVRPSLPSPTIERPETAV